MSRCFPQEHGASNDWSSSSLPSSISPDPLAMAQDYQSPITSPQWQMLKNVEPHGTTVVSKFMTFHDPYPVPIILTIGFTIDCGFHHPRCIRRWLVQINSKTTTNSSETSQLDNPSSFLYLWHSYLQNLNLMLNDFHHVSPCFTISNVLP